MEKVTAVIKALQTAFPNINGICDAHDLGYASKPNEAIHLGDCAEGGEICGLPACDYYAEDFEEETYIFGVHRDLHCLLMTNQFFAECHDAGTYIAFRA